MLFRFLSVGWVVSNCHMFSCTLSLLQYEREKIPAHDLKVMVRFTKSVTLTIQ